MKEPMLGMPKHDEGGACSEEDAQDVLDAIESKDAKALASVLSRLLVAYEEPDEDDVEEE